MTTFGVDSSLLSPESKNRPQHNIMQYLLGDTSIDKACSNKTKADRLIQVVKNKELMLKTQKVVRNITQKRRLIQEYWENCLKNEINLHNERKNICELSAIKIQKIVRGFLIRIKIEPLLLDQREVRSRIIIKELREQTDFCMLTLGSNTVPAVKYIQGAYRRYLFRKKLEIMRLAYQRYLKLREEIVCDFLRQVFWNYSCKIKRNYLVFLEYRVKRMEELKRNIAVLTVKKIWRSKKLSFKIVKEKFIKIKRRRAAMQNKEAYQKYLASLGGPNPPAKKDLAKKNQESNSKDSKQFEGKKEDEKTNEGKENENDPEEDEEYKEAQRIKDIIEKKIKEKIAKSKLAYAIQTTSTKVLLPMMQEKALNESLDNEPTGSKLFALTSSFFAKGRNLSREKPATTRNYMIESPKSLNQRKHFDGNYLPPLPIISLAETPLETFQAIDIKPVENQHFLSSTVSSINKTEAQIIPSWKTRVYSYEETKKSRKLTKPKEVERVPREFKPPERVNHWIPVARRFSTYVPGIDNSGYVPYKWKPLPLNRRILTSDVSSLNNPRHKSVGLSSAGAPTEGQSNKYQFTTRLKRFSRDHDPIYVSTQEQSLIV